MDFLMNINDQIGALVWGPPMLILIVGTGIVLTFMTKFFSLTKLGYTMKNTFMKIFSKEQVGEGEVTAFQAVSTALAATVGTGNIAGVGTAIAIGGPGAIFWMWLAAIFGMATKYAEVVLAIEYREKTPDGRFVGGPMYYIRNGVGWKWLGVIFAIFGALAAFGIGNMVQANSVADALHATFSLNHTITGVVLAVLTALVIVGGIKRIGAFTEKIVPLMAAIYILGGLLIIILNIGQVPAAFAAIFADAFSGSAAVGGFAGSTIMLAMRYGVARGVFTNEAGLGSAPIAHAAATTDHPARQGLWGIFEVFADTIVICTITALVIVMSGAWQTGLEGAALTTEAFSIGLPGGAGGLIVSFGIVFFAFSTLIGWEYYGERCAEYLFGPKAALPYRILFIPMIVVGSIGGLRPVWALADTLNGLMAIPNLIGLLILSPVVVKLTKDFFSKEKELGNVK